MQQFTTLFGLIDENQIWILQAFAIVLATLTANFIARKLMRRLLPKLEQTKTVWDDSLVFSLNPPLAVLIWVYGLSVAADLVGKHASQNGIFDFIDPARSLLTVAIILWFLIRFIGRIEWSYTQRKKAKRLDETTVHALCQLFRVSVIITAVLVGLQSAGIKISALLAFGGIGGIAIGFAAKEMLVNFFGGLMIYLDRPFSVGDWVRSPDKNIEGTVENIGWRLTRIRTFDKRPLYVPNGIFLSISVENPSRMTNRRIKTNVGIRYDDADKLKKIVTDIESMLRADPEIDSTQTLMVKFIEFGPSSLNFMVYTFTKTTNWVEFQTVQENVFLKILEIVERNGAQCAFPTRTLHLPDGVQLSQQIQESDHALT